MAMLAKQAQLWLTDGKNRELEKFDHNDPKRAGWKLKKSTRDPRITRVWGVASGRGFLLFS